MNAILFLFEHSVCLLFKQSAFFSGGWRKILDEGLGISIETKVFSAFGEIKAGNHTDSLKDQILTNKYSYVLL